MLFDKVSLRSLFAHMVGSQTVGTDHDQPIHLQRVISEMFSRYNQVTTKLSFHSNELSKDKPSMI